jgi:hypothetical protein
MSSLGAHISIWKRLLLAIAILFIVWAITIVYHVYQMVHSKIPESYAAWTTGNLMVEYLQTHTNRWPRSWDDLQEATNSLQEKGMPLYLPMGQLQERVKIDWQVDTRGLLQMIQDNSNIVIHVVSRLDGSRLESVWGADTEPNAKIVRYLKAAGNARGPQTK